MTNCKEWSYYPYFPATYPIYSFLNTSRPFSTTKLLSNYDLYIPIPPLSLFMLEKIVFVGKMLPLPPPPPIKHGTYDAPALIEKNLRRTCKNSIVEQSTASSRWTALVLREVNKPPHCFVVLLRPIFTMNAPKSSHAVWWKGGVQGARRSCGRSTINCDSTLCLFLDRIRDNTWQNWRDHEL
jgi:hypothetical protein